MFVQIKTPAISTPRKLKANAINERERINKYINQAYIELHSDSEIVDLDISGDTNFSRFVETNKIMKTSRLVPAIPATANTPAVAIMPPEDLIDYLTAKLISLDVKYTDYYKAFYFAEDGYHISGNNLSGYTKPNVDWVVVFKSANHQTAAHEFLHSFKMSKFKSPLFYSLYPHLLQKRASSLWVVDRQFSQHFVFNWRGSSFLGDFILC